MTLTGFNPANGTINRLTPFNGSIYAATWSLTNTHGAEIWRSTTGDSGTWSPVVVNGNGDSTNGGIPSLEVFNGFLYAGVSNVNSTVTPNTSVGGKVWRSSNGTTWSQVNTNGFGNPDNYAVRSFAVLNGSLYAGVTNRNFAAGTSTGGKIYRCTACDGSDWSTVISDGFGDTNNTNINSLITYNNTLYAAAGTSIGLGIWQTTNGTTWIQANLNGFGTSNNSGTCYNNSLTIFNNNLFIGTTNGNNGGQIWQTLNQLFLPLIMR